MFKIRTLNFSSYKIILKKHLRLILPETDDHNSLENKFVALRMKPAMKSEIISYLDKKVRLYVLDIHGAYAHVMTADDKEGYVNLSCLEFISKRSAKVIRTSGLNNSETNLILSLYSKCDREGVFKMVSMSQLAKDACIDRTTLYRSIARLENISVIEFDREKRTLKLLGLDKPLEHGYTKIDTHMLTKKFLNLPTDSKRLALYLIILQAKSGIQIRFSKLFRVSRKKTIFKLLDALRRIRGYFTFYKHKGFFIFHIYSNHQTVKSAIKSLGSIYKTAMGLLEKTGLSQVPLSDEDRFLIARIYNNYSPPKDLFTKVLNSAAEKHHYIKKSLPGYITGAIKNQLGLQSAKA